MADEFTDVSWDHPIFIIGTADGGSALTVDYEGYTCCLIYKHQELAELFTEHAANESGERYFPMPVRTDEEFYNGLRTLQSQRIEYALWDATPNLSAGRVASIGDLLDTFSDDA